MINWIETNGKDILAIIGAIVTVASMIVKLTPTPKDDVFLTKVINVLAALSLFNPDGKMVK